MNDIRESNSKTDFLYLLCLYLPSDEFLAFAQLKDFFELCSLNELIDDYNEFDKIG